MRKIFVGLLCFVTTLGIFVPKFVSAEISHPYVVDDKPQVIFGDSATIEVPNESHTATTTYHGLENYKQDYVNGFAHFTFTYTHYSNSYASYPPLAYITDTDPRTNNEPTEKSFQKILDAPSIYWYGPTDWYLVDVQFDETGFNLNIKQKGTTDYYSGHIDISDIASTDWVSVTNLYPRDPFIPDSWIYSMAFTPIPIVEASSIQTINPVIIIPGIMGSAKKNGEWVIDPILHTYDDLIATLEANGYEKDKNLFTFPYEWRDSNVLTANLLKSKIASVIQQCSSANLSDVNCNKVDLVAHSMGGLVAREYIQSDQYQNNVDQLIFLGTPHKGSPKAYLQWEGGEFPPDDLVSILLKIKFDLEAIRNFHSSIFDYIHNRPISSVQELLPIFDYLKEKDTEILRTYPNNYPRNTFLEYLNNDISKLLNSGVKIINITGNTGNNTIEKIRVDAGSNPLWINGKPDGFDGQTADRGLEKGSGDGTVTTNGSVLDASITNEEWPNVDHQGLPRETSARIFNILTDKIADNVIYLSPVEKIFSIHLQSPIDVVITAPDGKKIGKNFATDEEYNEIAGAFYSGFNNDDEEYITIPNPINGEYKIEVQGTESGGEYGVITSYITEETSTTNQIFGITKPNQITELNTQIDSQNPEILETKRVITLEVFKNDIKGTYDLGWIKDKKTRDLLIKQVEGAVKLQKRIETIYEKLPNGKKKAKRIERIELKVNKILLKLFDKELDFLFKKNKITQEALDLLKLDIKYLLDNN